MQHTYDQGPIALDTTQHGVFVRFVSTRTILRTFCLATHGFGKHE